MKGIKLRNPDLMINSGGRRMFYDSRLGKYIRGAKVEAPFHANRNNCLICGNRDELECHHIDKDRSNGDDSNITVLCKQHHIEVHSGKIKLEDYMCFVGVNEDGLDR